MSTLRFCTIANAVNLPMVAQLSRSLKTHHPEAQLTLALVERQHVNASRRSLLADVDEVLLADEIFGGGFDAWLAGRSAYIAACALKPALLRLLLARDDATGVVQLDPDMDVHARLDDVVPQVAEGAVLITPHLTTPGVPQAGIPQDERNCFRFGTYNLGFIAVGQGASTRAFLDWWDDRVRQLCSTDEPAGPFTDQGWIDLAPGMFEAVRVFRHAGFNLATWDATNRIVTRDARGALRANGEPLVVTHYSGWTRGDHAFALRAIRPVNPIFGELSDAFGVRLTAFEELFGPAPSWSYAESGSS
ncbi:MAG: hypothetical protein NTX95_00870 [Actinobacteria bacterium]|nr:hypothetical protein [Actinomycetota bacterium]